MIAFLGYRLFTITSFGWNGISLGLHLSSWRIDVHFGLWMFSFGRVPVYQFKDGGNYTVSNSFHYKIQTKTLNAKSYLQPNRG